MRQNRQPTTVAILSTDTVVERALSALLEGSGYKTRPLDTYPTGVVDEMLEGADLLLLAPRLNQGVYAKPSSAPWARARRQHVSCASNARSTLIRWRYDQWREF